MFLQRHVNVYVISFKNFRKMNQFMLSFIELEVVFFRSFNDFFHVFFNIPQFCSVNSLYVNMLMLFINSMTLKRNLTFLHDFNKFAL